MRCLGVGAPATALEVSGLSRPCCYPALAAVEAAVWKPLVSAARLQNRRKGFLPSRVVRHHSSGSEAECSAPSQERTRSWASREGAAVQESSVAAPQSMPIFPCRAGRIQAPGEETEKESQRRRGELPCRKVAWQRSRVRFFFTPCREEPVDHQKDLGDVEREAKRGEERRIYHAGQAVAHQSWLTASKDSIRRGEAPAVCRSTWCGRQQNNPWKRGKEEETPFLHLRGKHSNSTEEALKNWPVQWIHVSRSRRAVGRSELGESGIEGTLYNRR
ncbi:hypothetical protein NDU88_003170 [Pleurodeles waltl]|uniref:Uncharacterized protein n=1 Tax=Pleurodeles waltl TaxID=8319 RepID=A0AAV7M4L6_PLEWA|nr:hypothetical protein NDU88_003170 [Pleurodeles waltl]